MKFYCSQFLVSVRNPDSAKLHARILYFYIKEKEKREIKNSRDRYEICV